MTIYEELEEILDNERECIVGGDYEALREVALKKVKICEIMLTLETPLDQKIVGKIRAKSERNDSLLASAARGIKSAMSQLNEVTDYKFQSYSKEGSRSPLLKSNRIRQTL